MYFQESTKEDSEFANIYGEDGIIIASCENTPDYDEILFFKNKIIYIGITYFKKEDYCIITDPYIEKEIFVKSVEECFKKYKIEEEKCNIEKELFNTCFK